MAQDDWRVTARLHPEHAGSLRRALHEYEVEEEARERVGDRVIVGGGEDEGVVFLYAATREGAASAEQTARDILATHGIEADFTTHRWHPAEERWEDADAPLPSTDAELTREHERRGQDEIAESEELRAALWEVRIECDSHRDAAALADRLEGEADSLLPGWTVSVTRRWRYLLVGADNEDQASEIGERLRAELPPGATIHVEPSGALAWGAFRPSRFAVFGGLGS
jgi:hypothetical protein